MKEIWKPVVGYEGLYEVSNLGRVKALERRVKRGNHTLLKHETILKLRKNRGGYIHCKLSKDGVDKGFLVHRLVAYAFLDKPSGNVEINHIDCNKENNKPENLEWVTRTDNIRHAFSNNLMVRHRGERNAASVIDAETARSIKEDICKGEMYITEIAKKYGVKKSIVNHINNEETWTHIPWPGKRIKGKRYLRKETVAEIKYLLFKKGLSPKEVALKYGLSRDNVYQIKKGKTWKDVEPLRTVDGL